MACPHMYFVRYLLRVYEVEEPADEITITPLDRGSALHVALDRFNQAVLAGELPQPDSSGWTDQHVAALDGDLRPRRRRHRTRRAHRTSRVLGRRTRTDAVPTWPSGSGATRVGARPAASAWSAPSAGSAMPATSRSPCRADDRSRSRDRSTVSTSPPTARCSSPTTRPAATGTSPTISDDDPTASGTRLQLPSYAAAALARRRRPDAVVRAEYSFFAAGRVQARRIHVHARGLGRGRASGWNMWSTASSPASTRRSRNAPRGDRSRRASYCEPDKLGTAERWGEWDRKRHDPRLQRWFADPDARRSRRRRPSESSSCRSSCSMHRSSPRCVDDPPPDAAAASASRPISTRTCSSRRVRAPARRPSSSGASSRSCAPGSPITSIAAITFTEKAAADLRHRLRGDLDRRRGSAEHRTGA